MKKDNENIAHILESTKCQESSSDVTLDVG